MKKYLTIGLLALAWLLFPAGSCSGSGDPDSPVVNPGGGSGSGSGGSGSGSQPVPTATLGQPLPAWSEGMLDIHFINTTTGECTFLIFPDGTQMLIDAAGSLKATGLVRTNSTVVNTGIRARWDPTRESGWRVGPFLADYIKSCMAWTGNPTLDYAVLTHFHNDHFGRVDALNGNEPVSKLSPTYVLQSFPEMLDTFPVGLLLDRGYPTYDYPFDMAAKAGNAANCKNYITAVKWHVANRGLRAEKFKAGSRSQIVLKKKAADYPTFTVQNIAVNGEIWNGGTTTTATPTFPPLSEISVTNPASVGNADNCPEENHCSIVMKISYGKFDYFAGGDAQYDGMSSFAWKDMETPVARVAGEVDVMKADHHGVTNTNGHGFVSSKTGKTAEAMKYLKPKCWIVNSWNDEHPRQAVFEGVATYAPGMDIFITNTCPEMTSYARWSQVKGSNGHIVVRVAPGGDTYWVYVLSDSDRKKNVTKINGPYTSK